PSRSTRTGPSTSTRSSTPPFSPHPHPHGATAGRSARGTDRTLIRHAEDGDAPAGHTRATRRRARPGTAENHPRKDFPMHIPGFEARPAEVAPGVALHAETAAAGTPVVLLHGFPQTRHMWRHVATDLARDHRVVVPDLRGYGDSGKPAATTPDVYAKRTMGADVVALADALGIDRFVLVGHDRGALVAFRAALDHPDR